MLELSTAAPKCSGAIGVHAGYLPRLLQYSGAIDDNI
jgi:hypothetical protein